MGTKLNPGTIDCLAAALDDEEVFILLARDPLAPWIISVWASIRVGNIAAAAENFRLMGQEMLDWYRKAPDEAKSAEAINVATRMIAWRNEELRKAGKGAPRWKKSLVRPKMLVEIVEDKSKLLPGLEPVTTLENNEPQTICPTCQEFTCECDDVCEAVAWSYELATVFDQATQEYSGWKKRLSFDKPNVPAASIRNLTPLHR